MAVLNLWLGWAIANAIAGAITGALEEGGFQFAATLLFSGVFAGIAQWLLLRRRLPVRWWAIATPIGWILGLFLQLALRPSLPVFYDRLLFYFLPSMGMAIAQILVSPIVPRLGWVGAGGLGGMANALLASAVCNAVCQSLLTAFPGHLTVITVTAITYGSGWLAYGLITGVLLQRFLNQLNR
jgi:hypothetical protein